MIALYFSMTILYELVPEEQAAAEKKVILFFDMFKQSTPILYTVYSGEAIWFVPETTSLHKAHAHQPRRGGAGGKALSLGW